MLCVARALCVGPSALVMRDDEKVVAMVGIPSTVDEFTADKGVRFDDSCTWLHRWSILVIRQYSSLECAVPLDVGERWLPRIRLAHLRFTYTAHEFDGHRSRDVLAPTPPYGRIEGEGNPKCAASYTVGILSRYRNTMDQHMIRFNSSLIGEKHTLCTGLKHTVRVRLPVPNRVHKVIAVKGISDWAC